MSTGAFNAWPVGLVIVVQARLQRRLGAADPATVDTVADWLRRITGL